MRAREESRRNDRVDFFVHKLFGSQARPVTSAIAHADVDALGDIVDKLEACIEPDIGVGASRLEPVDPGHQPLRGEGRTDGYRQNTTGGCLLHALNPRAEPVEACPDIGKGSLGRFGHRQPHLARLAAAEEPGPQPVLETAHQLSDCRGRNVQFFGGAGKAAMAGCGFKGAKGVEMDRRPHGCSCFS
ncbi:hypothetical protein MesoLjLb_63080 [Mesorhizobium sp. L-8-3]|nr:hypothetical protein MesoLjLb_63080 [Mesorhizobium sp. L-8-3]